MKENFAAGRSFDNVTHLNAAALEWCGRQGSRYRKAVDCVPLEEHAAGCSSRATPLEMTPELSMYLCPRRKISFDGFVSYEGRRFGVPYWYSGKACRVNRDGGHLHIYSDDMGQELAVHDMVHQCVPFQMKQARANGPAYDACGVRHNSFPTSR